MTYTQNYRFYSFIVLIAFVSSVLIVPYVSSVLIVPYVSAQDERNDEQEVEPTCPANSYWPGYGTDCLCSDGYASPIGTNDCIPNGQICAKYGPSHLVNGECVCDPGYGIIDGGSRCQSLSVECAKLDGVRSAAANNCICKEGRHEDHSLNRCVRDAPPPETIKEEPKPETIKEEPKPEPVKEEPKPEPIKEEPKPEPIKEEPKVEPIKVEPKPEPVKEEPKVEPVKEEPKVEVVAPAPGEIIENIINEVYEEQTLEIKKVIKELTPLIQEIAKKPFVPEIDMYAGTSEEEIPLMKFSLENTLEFLPIEKKEEVKEQILDFSNFEVDGDEVLLEKKGVMETMKEEYVTKEFTKKSLDRRREVDTVINDSKVKEGKDKEKFELEKELSNRMKLQIASLEKTLRMNHMRNLEITKAITFEQQSAEYRAYWKTQVQNDFDASAEGIEFNRTSMNIDSISPQLREIKKRYKSAYPKGREHDRVEVSEQPDITQERKKVDENIFLMFERKLQN